MKKEMLCGVVAMMSVALLAGIKVPDALTNRFVLVGGHVVERLKNGQLPDGYKLLEVCIDESSGTNRIERLRELLDSGCNPNDRIFRGQSVLAQVVGVGRRHTETDCRMAELLLEHGAEMTGAADSGSRRRTVLEGVLADKCADGRMRSLFLSYISDSEAKRISLRRLYDAGAFAGDGGVETLKALLSKGGDPNEMTHGEPLLMTVLTGRRRFAGTNDLAVVKLLLEHGAEPNASSAFGEVPLWHAAMRTGTDDQVEIVRLLLDKGADPNFRDRFGRTLFGQLTTRGICESKLPLLRLLLERGMAVEGHGRDRQMLERVISLPTGTNKTEVVHLLVNRGVNITDWMICSAWRDADLRRYLLERCGKTEDDFEIRGTDAFGSVRPKIRKTVSENRLPSGGRTNMAVRMSSENPLKRIRDENDRKFHEPMRRYENSRIQRAELRPWKSQKIGFGTILLIAFSAVGTLAIVLASVSRRRRARYGMRDYGVCRHRNNVFESYVHCFARYADCTGRADRTEYWSFVLINGIIGIVLGCMGASELQVAFAVITFVPGLAVATRRLHDVGKSGLWLLLVLVPLAVIATFGNITLRKVRDYGWNETLFGIVLTASLFMVLVFGIWLLILYCRRGVEDVVEWMEVEPPSQPSPEDGEDPVRNADGSVTFSKIPPSGAMGMLRVAYEKTRASKPEAEDGRLAFLDAGKDGILRGILWKQQKKVIVDQAKCRLFLPDGWSMNPEVEVGNAANVIAKFAGPRAHEWASVEYLLLSPEHVNDDLDDWVNVSRVLFGNLCLHAHSGRNSGVNDCKEISFGRLSYRDTVYMKYHQADDMAAFAGTLEIEGRLHRIFIAIVRRGRDSWKFEYVFPAADSVTREAQSFRPEEIAAAARLFVPFETHGRAKCPLCGVAVDDPSDGKLGEGMTVWLKDFTLFDDMPKLGRGGVTLACCDACKEKALDEGLRRETVEGIPDVRTQLDKGASIAEIKCGEKNVSILD